MGKETGAVGELVVVATGAGCAALVQQLQVARVDGEGLIVASADKLSVADIVGPRSTAVGLAGEGVALGGSVGGPGSAERGGGERPEETALGAHGLDDHEVLVEAGEGVDLDSLEEVGLGVAHDDGGGGSEAAREVANGHRGAVDLAVVTAEEQVHVLAVTDHGLIDRAGTAAGDGSGEERLDSSPSVGVGWVGGGPVGESGRAPLVGKDPGLLGSEVEESGSNGSERSGGLAGGAKLAQAADGREGHGAILASVVGGVDELLAVEGGNSEVLKGDPSVLGLSKSVAGRPLVGGRELAGTGRDGRGVGDGSQKAASCVLDVNHGWKLLSGF